MFFNLTLKFNVPDCRKHSAILSDILLYTAVTNAFRDQHMVSCPKSPKHIQSCHKDTTQCFTLQCLFQHCVWSNSSLLKLTCILTEIMK